MVGPLKYGLGDFQYSLRVYRVTMAKVAHGWRVETVPTLKLLLFEEPEGLGLRRTDRLSLPLRLTLDRETGKVLKSESVRNENAEPKSKSHNGGCLGLDLRSLDHPRGPRCHCDRLLSRKLHTRVIDTSHRQTLRPHQIQKRLRGVNSSLAEPCGCLGTTIRENAGRQRRSGACGLSRPGFRNTKYRDLLLFPAIEKLEEVQSKVADTAVRVADDYAGFDEPRRDPDRLLCRRDNSYRKAHSFCEEHRRAPPDYTLFSIDSSRVDADNVTCQVDHRPCEPAGVICQLRIPSLRQLKFPHEAARLPQVSRPFGPGRKKQW